MQNWVISNFPVYVVESDTDTMEYFDIGQGRSVRTDVFLTIFNDTIPGDYNSMYTVATEGWKPILDEWKERGILV